MTTTPPSLPPISTLPTLPEPTHIQILDLLFEPSPALHALALPLLSTTPPHPTYPALIASVQETLTALTRSPHPADLTTLDAILGSHPRLGATKVDSAQSQAEQAQLQGQGQQLARLNEEYEARFPGLRYVIFVNGRGRDEIMRDMRDRMEHGTLEGERERAIQVSGLAWHNDRGRFQLMRIRAGDVPDCQRSRDEAVKLRISSPPYSI